MSGVMGKFLVTGIVLSSIVACSGSSGGDGKDTRLAPKGGGTYSCQFSFTEGGTADYSALGTVNITQAYFDKEYNLNLLAAVYSSSVENTLDFVNQTGATVYKSELIPTNLCSLSLFATAKTMTSDVKKRWNSANDSLSDDSIILGLYLPKTDSPQYPSLNKGAAIVVRENTNRWTLVHEFMHHLFKVRAAETGYNDETAKAEYTKLADALDKIGNDKTLTDEQKYQKGARPFIQYANAADTVYRQYFLEEVTIEATLKDAATAGVLKYVPTEEGNWYINKNANTALEIYQSLDNAAVEIIKALPVTQAEDIIDLTNLRTVFAKRFESVKKLHTRFPYDKTQGGARIFGHVKTHTGCSHEEEGKKLLEIGTKVTNIFNH